MAYLRFIGMFAVVLGAAAAASGADNALYTSLTHDFGRLKGNYVGSSAWPVSRQIDECLSIPGDTKSLPDGDTLVSGCRQHSCDEKAAVITGHGGKAIAAALINFHCTKQVSACENAPHLTIFVRTKNNRPALTKELQAWAKEAENATTTETVVVP
jgi:hypothetical protein